MLDASSSVYSFILGASAPDSVKALSMRLHDYEFATLMYQFAKQQQNTSSFDPVSFSLGYGFHLAQDFVGHFRTGYLNPKYDHEVEFAADTLLYQVYIRKLFPSSYPVALFNAEAKQFITEANEYFSAHSSTPFTPFNSSAISDSIDKFETTAKTESNLVVWNKVYKAELVAFNFCKSKDLDVVLKQLDLSVKWCQDASMQWVNLLNQAKVEPKDMTAQMSQFVESLYASHSGTIC